MRRQIPGLHSWQPDDNNLLEGLFLVRVGRAFFRWQPRKPFPELRFVVVELSALGKKAFFGRLYCTEKALWRFSWFLRDFGYDADRELALRFDPLTVCARRSCFSNDLDRHFRTS